LFTTISAPVISRSFSVITTVIPTNEDTLVTVTPGTLNNEEILVTVIPETLKIEDTIVITPELEQTIVEDKMEKLSKKELGSRVLNTAPITASTETVFTTTIFDVSTDLPVSRDAFLEFEKDVKVNMGTKKIRLLKLNSLSSSTETLNSPIHPSTSSPLISVDSVENFIDFEKEIKEKMGMKKIRLLKVMTTPKSSTVTTLHDRLEIVTTQSSTRSVTVSTTSPKRLLTLKPLSAQEHATGITRSKKRIVTLAPPSPTTNASRRKVVRPTVTYPPLISDDSITSTFETSSTRVFSSSATDSSSIKADSSSVLESNKFQSADAVSHIIDSQFSSSLENQRQFFQSDNLIRNSKVLSINPIQQISQDSLPRVVAAKLPIFIRKDDSYVRINNLPRSPKFFKDSSRGQSVSVPASKVSRIVNDNGRIHLVNVDQTKPNIGGLVIRYQLAAHLSPTAKITPVFKSTSRLPRKFFS